MACIYQTESRKDKCYPKSLSGGHRVATKVSGQTLECNFVGGYIMTVVGSHQFSQHLPSWNIIVNYGELESSYSKY